MHLESTGIFLKTQGKSLSPKKRQKRVYCSFIPLIWSYELVVIYGFDIGLECYFVKYYKILYNMLTSDPNHCMQPHRRMSGYLTDIKTRILLLQIHHLQPPVVGVAEGRLDPGVPGVGGLAHCQ